MKNTVGVLLIVVGVLLLLAGAFSLVTTLVGFISGSSSAYSIGFYLGRGLVGLIFLALGWKAFSSGRRRMAGSTMATRP